MIVRERTNEDGSPKRDDEGRFLIDVQFNGNWYAGYVTGGVIREIHQIKSERGANAAFAHFKHHKKEAGE